MSRALGWWWRNLRRRCGRSSRLGRAARPWAERLESRSLLSGDTLGTAGVLLFNAAGTAHAAGFLRTTNEVDLYRLGGLAAGDVVRVAVGALSGGSGLRSALRVFDSSGRPVALDVQEGGDPLLTFQVPTPATGDYFVGVSSAGDDAYDPTVAGSGQDGETTGSFTLDVRRMPGQPPTANLAGNSFRLRTATAAYGESVSGTFVVGNQGGADAAGFDVEVVVSRDNLFGPGSLVLATFPVSKLPAGQMSLPQDFTVALPDLAAAMAAGLPGSGPVYLGLRIDPAGTVPELDPFAQSGVHRGADWEALTIVSPVTASGGNHSLASADALADPNSRVSGTLTAGQTDWYQLTLAESERLTAQVTAASGSTLVPRLALYGPQGQLLIQSDGGSIVQLLRPGTYSLAVSARSGAGAYQLLTQVVPASPSLQPLAAGQDPLAVVVADVNGDGYPDVIAANSNDGTVSVLLGNGDGSFRPPQSYLVGKDPLAVVVADVNGDGKPDLVVANTQSGTVGVLVGRGDGTFEDQQTFPVGFYPAAVAVADIDGDGRPDLMVANYLGGTVSVLLNQTAAGAADLHFASQQPVTVGTYPAAVAAVDVNGDGLPDLVVANNGSNMVSVLLGKGDGTFSDQQTYDVGRRPDALAVADVNGDGKPDIITANFGSDTVSVLAGNGDGTFGDQQTFAVGSGPSSLAVADVNGDGKPDLVTANVGYGSTSATISVLLNETAAGAGPPGFAPQRVTAVGTGLQAAVAADVNGDGVPDLVTADATTNVLGVLPGNGDGTFQTPEAITIGPGSFGLAAADFNGDGKPDLVTANFHDNTVSVLLGNGDGTFQPQRTFAVGGQPQAVAAADLNGDGKPDIVTANSYDGTVSVLLGNGDGTFQPQQVYKVGQKPDGVAVADFNGDGRPDLVVANFGSNTVSVLLGNGDGTFQDPQTFAVDAGPYAVAVGDVNGDGRPDIVTANFGSGTVSILLNQTASGATASRFAPEVAVAVGQGPKAVAVADANGDGTPDLITADSGSNTVSVLPNETPPGAAGVRFGARQSYAVGNSPDAVAVADVNGDGAPDVIVANRGNQYTPDNTVSVLLGQADGTLGPPHVNTVATLPASVVATDVNGDGKPDIIAACDQANVASVLLGHGDGSFAPPSRAAGVGQRNTPYLADLTGDGIPDSVILNSSGDIIFRRGLPGGANQFAPPTVLNAGRPARAIALLRTASGWAVAAADAGSDPDLSSADRLVYTVSVYAIDSRGQITRTTAFSTPLLPTAIAAGDLTGDGLGDIVVAYALDDRVSVALHGDFGSPVTLAVGVAPSALALVPVNGDATLDIVVTDQASGDVSVLLNDAAHSFTTAERFRTATGVYGLDPTATDPVVSSPVQPVSLAAGSFTGAGRNDLVVVNRGAHSIALLANDGNGGFDDPRAALTTSTSDGPAINDQPGPVVAGYFHGPGQPLDLAVLMEDVAEVWIYTGDGHGHFTHTASVPAGSSPTGLSVVPGSGPGLFDLLVGNPFGDILRLVGDGRGHFQPLPFTGDRTALAVQSLRADGQPNVLVADQRGNSVTVQAPIGGGTRFAPVQTLAAGSAIRLAPGAVSWAKLEGRSDPFFDAVVVASGANAILVYRGTGFDANGNPTFAAPVSYSVGTDPAAVTIQDINGDGVPDMIVANQGSNDVSVLFGSLDQEGRWVARAGPRLKANGLGPVATALRDMNSDGIPDLVVTNAQSGTFTVLPGRGLGFFDDRPQKDLPPLPISGTPIGPPSFFGTSGRGVVTTAGGQLIGFDLDHFAGSVQVLFTPPAGGGVAVARALPDGDVLAALDGGDVVQLAPGAGGLEVANTLVPLSGIPSDPSALEVLQGESGLRVLVTEAGGGRVFVFGIPGLPEAPPLPPPAPAVATIEVTLPTEGSLILILTVGVGAPPAPEAPVVGVPQGAGPPAAAAGALPLGDDGKEDPARLATPAEGIDLEEKLRELDLYQPTPDPGGSRPIPDDAAPPGEPDAPVATRSPDEAGSGAAAARPPSNGESANPQEAVEPADGSGARAAAARSHDGETPSPPRHGTGQAIDAMFMEPRQGWGRECSGLLALALMGLALAPRPGRRDEEEAPGQSATRG